MNQLKFLNRKSANMSENQTEMQKNTPLGDLTSE